MKRREVQEAEKLAKGGRSAITCSQGAGHAHVVVYPARGAGGEV
ncbi:MAG TPA: hypothetical protein VE093_34970 [Polyangiaceae bacterium]|nr:hypothetical protein [Polyangiaceae bacterium]